MRRGFTDRATLAVGPPLRGIPGPASAEPRENAAAPAPGDGLLFGGDLADPILVAQGLGAPPRRTGPTPYTP